MKKTSSLFIAFFVIAILIASAQSNPGEYKVLKTIPVEGEGGWDYLVVDKPLKLHPYLQREDLQMGIHIKAVGFCFFGEKPA
jgi:hypothetical protein